MSILIERAKSTFVGDNKMKKHLLCVALLTGLTMFQLPGLAQTDAGKNSKSTFDVVFSEVCYWPKEGEPEWIELTNVSDKPVDIKGWEIIDGQTLDIKISEQSLIIPPKNCLVVKLDGTGEPVTPFKDNQAVVHFAKGVSGNLLGDQGGQIALYSFLNDGYEPPVIHSFVAWGRSPGSIIDDAIVAGRWGTPENVVSGSGPGPTMGPMRNVIRGGSIGLVLPTPTSGAQWGAFLPSELNPGQLDMRRGVIISPLNTKVTDEKGYANIQVIWMELGTKYEFQVCMDEACTKVYIDAINEGADYHIEKPIPPDMTYYWRARLIYSDDTRSEWSEVRSISNVKAP